MKLFGAHTARVNILVRAFGVIDDLLPLVGAGGASK